MFLDVIQVGEEGTDVYVYPMFLDVIQVGEEGTDVYAYPMFLDVIQVGRKAQMSMSTRCFWM